MEDFGKSYSSEQQRLFFTKLNEALNSMKNAKDSKHEQIKESRGITKSVISSPDDLLNATTMQSIDFVMKLGAQGYKDAMKYLFLPYETTIEGKYGRFMDMGHTPSYSQKLGNKLGVQYQRTQPREKIKFNTEIVGDYGQYIYRFNDETNCNAIRMDYPYKAETFVRASIDRSVFSAHNMQNGNVVSKRGFSRTEFAKSGKIIKSEYRALYEGLTLALSEDVIMAVTKEKAKFITMGLKFQESLVHEENLGNPMVVGKLEVGETPNASLKLVEVARFIRGLANQNDTSKGEYNYRNDVFLHDYFVTKTIDKTREMVDSKCMPGSFEILNELVEKLASSKTKVEFEDRSKKLEAMLKWMESEVEKKK